MIWTFVCEITPLYEEKQYRRCYEALPQYRKDKADRAKNLLNKCQSIGVYSLYMEALKRYNLSENLPYNFSHSGEYALCAIGSAKGVKVGCDIEVIKDRDLALARRYFNDSEVAYVMEGTDKKECMARLIRVWTLKESFMKAVGQGSNLSTKAFTIEFDEKNKPILIRKPEIYMENYSYRDFIYNKTAQIAVCGTSDISKKLITLKLLNYEEK